jgi:hypothetical protein
MSGLSILFTSRSKHDNNAAIGIRDWPKELADRERGSNHR